MNRDADVIWLGVNETHVGPVATGSDRVHHSIYVFTGVSRVWRGGRGAVKNQIQPIAPGQQIGLIGYTLELQCGCKDVSLNE